MSIQRRRGQSAIVYKQILTVDSRGNEQYIADLDSPIEVRAAFIPDRSSKAEVPGQVEINTYHMIVRHDIPDIGTWTRVDWLGRSWDIVAPAAYRHGTRHTRHQTLTIRERPHDG